MLFRSGDPGAYIVQARGPIDNAFRAMLASAGAEIVSYIPNNAYLVRAQAGVANGLAGNPLTQGVIPYEPYYKIQSSLLAAAVEDKVLPPGTELNLGLFADTKPHILEDVQTKLEAGMTIIVHPNTYHPEAGYIVLGDSAVVRHDGPQVLTATPRVLFSVPA